jgi:hypothetical protein
MIHKQEEPDEDCFYYDLDEAAAIVWENIPQYLVDKYEFEEIYFILETEFDYLSSIGIMLYVTIREILTSLKWKRLSWIQPLKMIFF